MHLGEHPVLYIFMSPTCSTMMIVMVYLFMTYLVHHPFVIP